MRREADIRRHADEEIVKAVTFTLSQQYEHSISGYQRRRPLSYEVLRAKDNQKAARKALALFRATGIWAR